MTTYSEVSNHSPGRLDTLKWVRSRDGWIAGVCQGLGERFGVSPLLIRIGWLVSVLAFGTGLLIYILLALSLPLEDEIDQAYESKFLGVCANLAERSGMEVGIVRFLTLLVGLGSLGLTMIAYFVLYLVLDDKTEN